MNAEPKVENFGSSSVGGYAPKTRHGDFVISVLVLLAKVMKADCKLLKYELDNVKSF